MRHTLRYAWVGALLASAPIAHAADNAGHDARHGEHAAALSLVSDAAVTHVALRSGPWSDPATWRNRERPASEARVLVPHGATVVVDSADDRTTFDTIRIDGTLRFRPDVDTALAVRTIVVTGQGRLEIGTNGSPVSADVRARLLLAPRAVRDRRADPFDLAGGLIAQGTVTMMAAHKTSHAPLHKTARRGTTQLEFAQPLYGWRVGDRLLVPGMDPAADQDETPAIVALRADRRVVELDRALAYDHRTPSGVPLWLGNLTRNIEVRSVLAAPLAARGHVMIMHAQTGTLIDGAAFVDLGRTDTRIGHTIPRLDETGATTPGSDDNTIGRYALHFHVRAGALRSVAPHVVRHSVVMDSPKYGIVNHGGHVLAEDNVTFRVAGSHLVGENGSEVGVFRRNMAVRSTGSGDASILSRMGIYDNAHGGNGIWLVSGGIEVTGNWASGQADSGLKMLGMRFFEQQREILFDARNLGVQPVAYADGQGQVALADVNLDVRGNFFAASTNGIELWNHKESARHRERSVIASNTIWAVRKHAIFLPYTRNTTLAGNRLVGEEGNRWCPACSRLWVTRRHRLPFAQAKHDQRCKVAAIDGNRATANIEIVGGRIEQFVVGIRLPQQGNNLVSRVALDNAVDIEVPGPSVPGRHIRLDSIAFAAAGSPGHLSIYMQEIADPFSADVAILFGDDRTDFATDGNNQRLFFPAQARQARAFRRFGPQELRSLTSGEIEQRFGLALGGSLAPADAKRLAASNALAAPAPAGQVTQAADEAGDDPNYWQRWLYDPHLAAPAADDASEANEGRARWARVRERLAALRRDGVLSQQATRAVFVLHPTLEPLQIHPDDVQYGYRILGYIADKVDGNLRAVAHFEDFTGLKIGPDGFVRVRSRIAQQGGVQGDAAELAIRVTPDARRRGPNLDWFLQKAYCGSCGGDITKRANGLLASAPQADGRSSRK